MGKAFVFLNGELDIDAETCRSLVSEKDYVFCADGGANHVKTLGIVPDLVMGDMDSVGDETREWLKGNNVEMRIFPREKDCSDTELLLDHIFNEGFRDISVFAATGGRIDHQLANQLLLEKYTIQGACIRLMHRKGFIEGIRGNTEVLVTAKSGWLFSFFSLSDTAVVSLDGFRYGLDAFTVSRGATVGLSNVVESDRAKIIVHKGEIISMFQKDEGI